MSEKTVKCPICGDPYVVLSMMAGDQSACPSCRAKARRKMFPSPISPWKQGNVKEDKNAY